MLFINMLETVSQSLLTAPPRHQELPVGFTDTVEELWNHHTHAKDTHSC